MKIIDTIIFEKDDMPSTSKQIAKYIINNPKCVTEMSVSELAKANFCSTGAIIKFCKRLDLEGYEELKFLVKYGESHDPIDDTLRNVRNIINENKNEHIAIANLLKTKKVYIFASGLSNNLASDFYFH